MTPTISITLFLIFTFLSSVHIYWGLGGKWVGESVFPTKDDNIKPQMPGPLPTFIVAVGLFAIGLFILLKGGFFRFTIPALLDQYGLWIIAGIFLIRAIGEFNYVGFFKKIRHTKFGINDTKYYSPLCLFIGLMIIIMALDK